jgi:hypothetical protein
VKEKERREEEKKTVLLKQMKHLQNEFRTSLLDIFIND